MASARGRIVTRAVMAEIRAEMGRQNIKALALSTASGIPNSTLGTLIKDEAVMDVDQLALLCRALELDPGAVLSQALSKVTLPAPGRRSTGVGSQDALLDAIDKPKRQRKVVAKPRNADIHPTKPPKGDKTPTESS